MICAAYSCLLQPVDRSVASVGIFDPADLDSGFHWLTDERALPAIDIAAFGGGGGAEHARGNSCGTKAHIKTCRLWLGSVPNAQCDISGVPNRPCHSLLSCSVLVGGASPINPMRIA